MRLIAKLESELGGEPARANEARQVWLALEGFARSCEPEAIDAALFTIMRAYSAPERHFHNTGHLTRMLGHLADRCCFGDLDNSEISSLLAAIVYHDIVYAGEGLLREHNETASAAVARQELLLLDFTPSEADMVAELVLATRHGASFNKTGQTKLAAIVSSLDLAELAGNWDVFLTRGAELRAESTAADACYTAARSAFFDELLAGPSLYGDKVIAGWFEKQARRNMKRWQKGAAGFLPGR